MGYFILGQDSQLAEHLQKISEWLENLKVGIVNYFIIFSLKSLKVLLAVSIVELFDICSVYCHYKAFILFKVNLHRFMVSSRCLSHQTNEGFEDVNDWLCALLLKVCVYFFQQV